jgi:hypothetical protein
VPIASGGTGARRDLRSDSHRRAEPIRVPIHQNRMNDICELCERSGRVLTFHHLVPRHCHGKKRFRRRFTLKEMRERGLWLCNECHSGIHDLIPDEKILGWSYNTRELLLTHEGISRHLEWVKKQK